jgi:hypothetical protein
MIAWATPAPSRAADRFTRDIARWAADRQLAPIAVSSFSLGFAVIAAAWLTEVSARGQAIGFVALVASVLAGRVARLMDCYPPGGRTEYPPVPPGRGKSPTPRCGRGHG